MHLFKKNHSKYYTAKPTVEINEGIPLSSFSFVNHPNTPKTNKLESSTLSNESIIEMMLALFFVDNMDSSNSDVKSLSELTRKTEALVRNWFTDANASVRGRKSFLRSS